MFPRPILLASKSPRRAQLLREAGFDFQVIGLDVEEDFSPDMPVELVAETLARRKAVAALSYITDQEIILAADSVVILEGVIFNKPADYAEAFAMIRRLSGKEHQVITGVCLLDKTQEISFSGISSVQFAPLSDAEIDFYLRTCRPYDKAGAYGVQEWIGHCKIQRIEGTYTNVMGLPVQLVYEHIQRFAPGWIPA